MECGSNVIRDCVVFLRRFLIFDFRFLIENADCGSIENQKSAIENLPPFGLRLNRATVSLVRWRGRRVVDV
jgi:hypothetical protein